MDEGLKRKISALMEMAKRGGSEHEMNIAMQKVQELLMKHNLDMSDVQNVDIKDEDIILDSSDGVVRQVWQRSVWAGIAKLYFCKFYSSAYDFLGKERISFCLVGKQTNIEAAKLIANYIVDLGNELAAKSGQDLTYRNSFKKGFASRVYSRCIEEIQAASKKLEHDNRERGLIVLNPYAVALQANDAFLRSKGIRLQSSSGRAGISNGEGYRAGQAAGNAVNLKQSATGRIGYAK